MSSNQQISRRNFLQLSLAGIGSLSVGSWPLKVLAQDRGGDPHFFFQVIMTGGMDPTYMFDARPLEMTKNGRLQNYLGQEPFLWEGRNGTSTWASEIVRPLETYKNDFSILNGVLMATTFDGHEQNINYLFAGNPFGGASFIPHLNQLAPRNKTPMDAIIKGSGSGLAYDNHNSVVSLTLESFNSLVSKLRSLPKLENNDPTTRYLRSRMTSLGQGSGSFSQGSMKMFHAHQMSSDLYSKFLEMKPIPGKDNDPDTNFVNLAMNLFRAKIATGAIFTGSQSYDTHDATSAKQQPNVYKGTVETIAKILRLFKETPYDSQRSFLDVTTLMFASEFGRTMKSSPNAPVDNTGTNHNPLTNTILMAGKGIRSGYVVGSTDLQTSSETPSKAHLSLDQAQVKMMGRPFDFDQMQSRPDKPESFEAKDYLTIHSVVNTLYSSFGVPESAHREISRNGPKAKILKALQT